MSSAVRASTGKDPIVSIVKHSVSIIFCILHVIISYLVYCFVLQTE